MIKLIYEPSNEDNEYFIVVNGKKSIISQSEFNIIEKKIKDYQYFMKKIEEIYGGRKNE